MITPARFFSDNLDSISISSLYLSSTEKPAVIYDETSALKGDNPLYVIICMCIGVVIGELIDIDKLLNNFGILIDKRLSKDDNLEEDANNLSKGFVSASLLYCVGAMAVVGAIQSGLSGEHSTLFAKSILQYKKAL